MRMGNFAAVADQGNSFDHPVHDRVRAPPPATQDVSRAEHSGGGGLNGLGFEMDQEDCFTAPLPLRVLAAPARGVGTRTQHLTRGWFRAP